MLHVQEQRGSPLPQYSFTYLSIRHYKKTLYLICYNIVSALYFDFFGHKACENLASRPGIESITSALAGKVLTTGKLIVKLKKKKKSLSTTKLWISQQYRGIILFTSVFSKQGLVFESGSVPGSQQTSSNSSFQAVRRRQLRLHGLSCTRIAGVLDFPRLTWFSPRETVCSTPAFEKQDIFFKA